MNSAGNPRGVLLFLYAIEVPNYTIDTPRVISNMLQTTNLILLLCPSVLAPDYTELHRLIFKKFLLQQLICIK